MLLHSIREQLGMAVIYIAELSDGQTGQRSGRSRPRDGADENFGSYLGVPIVMPDAPGEVDLDPGEREEAPVSRGFFAAVSDASTATGE